MDTRSFEEVEKAHNDYHHQILSDLLMKIEESIKNESKEPSVYEEFVMDTVARFRVMVQVNVALLGPSVALESLEGLYQAAVLEMAHVDMNLPQTLKEEIAASRKSYTPTTSNVI